VRDGREISLLNFHSECWKQGSYDRDAME
jgi:hypothetical protein